MPPLPGVTDIGSDTFDGRRFTACPRGRGHRNLRRRTTAGQNPCIEGLCKTGPTNHQCVMLGHELVQTRTSPCRSPRPHRSAPAHESSSHHQQYVPTARITSAGRRTTLPHDPHLPVTPSEPAYINAETHFVVSFDLNLEPIFIELQSWIVNFPGRNATNHTKGSRMLAKITGTSMKLRRRGSDV